MNTPQNSTNTTPNKTPEPSPTLFAEDGLILDEAAFNQLLIDLEKPASPALLKFLREHSVFETGEIDNILARYYKQHAS